MAVKYGGVFNPIANTWAIGGSFKNVWTLNPDCLIGRAAALVEKSGGSASFYAQNITDFEAFFPWQTIVRPNQN